MKKEECRRESHAYHPTARTEGPIAPEEAARPRQPDALLEAAYAKLRAAAEDAPWIPAAPAAPVASAAPIAPMAKRPKRGPKKRKDASLAVGDLTSPLVEGGNAPVDLAPRISPDGPDQPQLPDADKKI